MNKGLAAATVLLGMGYLALILRMPVGTVEDPVGPRLFPMLIAIGVAMVGMLMWIEARRSVAPPTKSIVDAVAETAPRRGEVVGIAGVAGGALLFMGLMEPLGYLPAAFLLVFAMLCAFNRGRHALNLAVAAGLSGALYFGLKRGLGVSLPGGLLDRLG